MKKISGWFILTIMLTPSLVFAMPYPVTPEAPEPISTSLFIAGGAVLLAAKLRKK